MFWSLCWTPVYSRVRIKTNLKYKITQLRFLILWNIQPCVLLYLVSHCQMLYQLSYIWRQNWTGLTVHSSLGSIRQLPTRPNEKLSAVYFLNQHTCFECAWLINKVFFLAKFISQSCKISVSIANSWLKRGSIGDANISLSIAEKGVKTAMDSFGLLF